MRGIVDRYEEGFCIIEVEGHTREVPVVQVEDGVVPGDVVEWEEEHWVKLPEQTRARQEEIAKLMNDLWED